MRHLVGEGFRLRERLSTCAFRTQRVCCLVGVSWTGRRTESASVGLAKAAPEVYAARRTNFAASPPDDDAAVLLMNEKVLRQEMQP